MFDGGVLFAARQSSVWGISMSNLLRNYWRNDGLIIELGFMKLCTESMMQEKLCAEVVAGGYIVEGYH